VNFIPNLNTKNEKKIILFNLYAKICWPMLPFFYAE
jgi:hypothetical protein